MKHRKLLALMAAALALLLIFPWLWNNTPRGAANNPVVPAPQAAVHSAPDTRLAGTIALEQWAKKFSTASNNERLALEAEGATVARARLTALANLMQSDPEQALANELPYAIRRVLPPAVQALLEERVSARTDYDVMGLVPLPGRESESAPIIRALTLQGERYQVFASGAGAKFVTRTDFPVSGIAVPANYATTPLKNPLFQPAKLMALRSNPARVLGADETAEVLRAERDAVCGTSGLLVSAQPEPTVVELAGTTLPFCGPSHAQAFADGEGTSAGDPPIAYAYNSIGTKRYLFMRVRFSDGSFTISSNAAVTLLNNLSNFFATMSYGKLLVSPVSASPASGSAVTPELQLNQPASYYDNEGLSRLYPDALAAAAAAGYTTANYHFPVVFTSSKPAAGYAGVAYVGARGAHIANSYFDERVTSHELGHNKGLWHAHYWNTGNASTIGAGTSDEYGGPYDVMGYGGYNAAHYSAGKKYVLGWITAAMAPLAPSGTTTYRLYTHDQQSVNNLISTVRASRSGQDYFVEYRSRYSGDDMRNGVLLHWCDDDGNNATVLDARPGESGDALYLGRTFSDTSTGVHITPVARGNVSPDYMDVVVTLGNASSNRPPIVIVTADRATATTGQTINFNASATDTNGNALAYYWEFGDGTHSIANDSDESHSFGTAGEYAVQCTVSDMRGGTARDTVIVRIGSPNVFRISGRVVDQNSQPVRGIKVSAGSKFAYTDSDGTYTIVGLAAGNYTVSCAELVLGNTSFAKPFFSNPVTVGPNFSGADFLTGNGPAVTYTTIINSNATWRYLDDGTDQGVAWRATNFNDAAWSNGAGVLGYGQSNETTVLDYGPDAANKFVTYYFRRAFTLANPTNFPSYNLGILRDDGFVAYLNGVEIWRDNMPTGAITAATLAVSPVEPSSYLATNLPPSLFVTGTNVLAVEVHQVERTSSDVNFDLQLRGLSPTSLTGQRIVYLSTPSDWSYTPGPTNVNLAATALAEGGEATRLQFYANNVKIGEDTNAPFTFTWTNANLGTNSLRAIATFDTGVNATSAPVVIVVTPRPVSLALISTGAVWRYYASNAAPLGVWPASDYNDAAWPSGAAELGYGDGDEATVVPSGPVNNFWITTYYRRVFHVNDPGSVTNVSLALKRDDGAIVYLNGTEVVRDGMAAGAVNYLTRATSTVSGADEDAFFNYAINPALLMPGTNVIAVEVHQVTNTSSDVSFDLRLDGLAPTNRARGVWLTSPTSGANFTLPASVPFAAQVAVASNAGVSRIEFYVATTKVGEATNHPYAFNWPAVTSGTFALTAVLRETSGASATSAPVFITLRAPAPEVALVSFGDVWRYLDQGGGPATNWASVTNFDDSLWNLGAAKFGYGGDGESTVVSYGPDSNTKFTTTWFRKAFTVANPAAYGSVKLRVVRDDGAAVYLNGTEVWRNNLPVGPLTSNTFALTAIGTTNEYVPIEAVVTNLLRAGTNVVAVEVHQNNLTSSDLGFDLALSGLLNTNLTQGIFLTSPASGERFTNGATITLTSFAQATSAVTQVEYFADGIKVAEGVTLPYAATWTNAAPGSHMVRARATLANSVTLTSAPLNILVAPPVFAMTLVPASGVWRYHDEGLDLGIAWSGFGFDDAAWDVGSAKLGFGDPDIITSIASTRADLSRIITYYFRKDITVSTNVIITNLALRVQRDDGVIFYLNGTEAWRDTNMPPGLVTASTQALSALGGTNETVWVAATLNPALLQGDQNLLAAEVHQNGTNSSDLGFALELIALGYIDHSPLPAPPQIIFSSTGGNLNLSFPESNGRVFVIEASIDLQNWSPVATNTVSGGQFQFSMNPSQAVHQFFRVVWTQ
jgi:hypothetical protein